MVNVIKRLLIASLAIIDHHQSISFWMMTANISIAIVPFLLLYFLLSFLPHIAGEDCAYNTTDCEL
jgi:hypothetical protein